MQPCSIVDIDWESDIARAIDLRGVWIASQPGALYRRSEPRQAAVSPGRLYGNDSYLVRAIGSQQQYADLGPVATTSAVTVGMIAIGYAVNVLGVSTRSTSSAAGFDLLWGRGGVAGTQSFRVGANSNPSESSTHSGLSGSVAYHYIGAWDAAQEGGRVRLLVDGTWDAGTGGQRTTAVTHSQNLMYARRGTTYWTGYAELIYWGLARAADPAVYAELSADPYAALVRKRPRRRIYLPGVAAEGGTGELSGTGELAPAGLAALAAEIGLAGVAVQAMGGTASPAVAVPLSATGINVTAGQAGLVAAVSISAQGLAQAAGAAGVSADVLLAAAGAAAAAGEAQVAAEFAVAAQGVMTPGGSATADASADGALAATGAMAPAGEAVLRVVVSLAAAGTMAPGGAAMLSGGLEADLAAAGMLAPAAQGTLAAEVAIAAAGALSPAGQATASTDEVGAISASGTLAAAGAAMVTAEVQLTAAGIVAAAAAGYMVITVPLRATGLQMSQGFAVLTGGEAETLIPTPDWSIWSERRIYTLDAPTARDWTLEASPRDWSVLQ